ncbi:mitochondrial carrier homolog 1 isoform X2 [Haemorhous mexicanus]|uniref:mitochondrial carrier homolog 1 isoform X2 n=1 Tax=Haemorhous mexicanus TaxID=30427 RepID=UPI0028BF3FE2|nr:mitochondrial carrier homolog 1 isoform X2 [Haemorhous mexicanus]
MVRQHPAPQSLKSFSFFRGPSTSPAPLPPPPSPPLMPGPPLPCNGSSLPPRSPPRPAPRWWRPARGPVTREPWRRCPRGRCRRLAGARRTRRGLRAPRACSCCWARGSPPPATPCSTSNCLCRSARGGERGGRRCGGSPVGHEPLPPTIGRNVLGRKVLYLPGFFTYARHIVEVDGKRGLFRGLTPRLISSTLSTVTRGSVKKAFPLEDMEHVSNKDDVKTSLRKVVRETSHEMMMQCVSRVVSHPLHVISMRCMVQFVGREVKYSGVFSAIGRIFKEEGVLGFFVGLVPHVLGDVIFLWCCNLLAHFINTYAVDDNFSQASVIRSYTKFVMGIAVSMLTYPFLLVGDLMAVNNCGLRAGLPPYAPAFASWIHCWRYLSAQGQLFRGSSLLFRRAPIPAAFPID